MTDLVRLARKAIRKTIITEGYPGKIGKADGTVYYTDDNGVTYRNRVWVRLSVEGTQTEIVAWCIAVTPQLHLPVRVAKRENGWTVIGLDRSVGAEYGGGRALSTPPHWFTHLWLGSDPAFLDSRSFMGFGVRPSNPPALTVDVRGGFYRYQGTLKQLSDTTTSSLSAYRPSSTGIRHFVIVCLDRENNSVVIVDGDDKSIAAGEINRSDVVETSIDSAYYPMAAIRLVNGQSEIRLPDIIHDVRLWAGGAAAGSETGGPDSSTDNAIARWDGATGTLLQDSNVLIDDVGRIILPTTPFIAATTTGAVEYDGHTLAFTAETDRRSVSLANGVVTSDTTVANTVTETTIYTETVSADEMFRGSKWHTLLSGYYSTTNATDTFTFRLKVGSTTVISLTSVAENVTDGFWRAEFFFTVRETGASGAIQAAVEAVFNDNINNSANTLTTSIDTTVAENITATVQWDNADAGNTFTLTQGHTDVFGVNLADDLLLESGEFILLESGDHILTE